MCKWQQIAQNITHALVLAKKMAFNSRNHDNIKGNNIIPNINNICLFTIVFNLRVKWIQELYGTEFLR